MNINELQPRVFWHGEMWQVREIDFTSKSLWIENSRRHSVIYEDYENIKIDRPVGMIKDIHGKEIMLHENDILRAFTHFDEEEPENNIYEDSVITWCGDLPGYSHYYAFEAFPREDVDYNYIASIFNDSEYVGIEIIGNVHENPDLAPDWWKNRNVDSR